MIELEIEGLTAEEQRILGAGSAMGIAFPAWAVAAALGEDQAVVEEACAALARQVHFVERGGQDELPDGTQSEFYVFVHGLYREVLYRRLAATRRAEWHARIAERLGSMFKGREWAVAREIAMHHESAGEWMAQLALCAPVRATPTRIAPISKTASCSKMRFASRRSLPKKSAERACAKSALRLSWLAMQRTRTAPASGSPEKLDKFWTRT